MNGLEHDISEKSISDALGIERKQMKDLRDCLDEGWEMRSGAIWFSEKGLQDLLLLLGLDDLVPLAELAKKCREEPPPEADKPVVELTVAKFYKNTRIMGCTLEGKMQRVRVKNHKNFKIGMVVPCRNIMSDLWELARKAPRSPGRW